MSIKWWFYNSVVRRFHRQFVSVELWNLDYTIANFILPRLKAFKVNLHGYPSELTFEEWQAILDKMVLAFDLVNKQEEDTEEQQETINEGLTLFAKYYQHLWD